MKSRADPRRVLPPALILALLLIAPPAAPAQEAAARAPGWIGAYEPIDGPPPPVPVVRIDPRPAFSWGDSPPHPLIAAGRFRARWRAGVSLLDDEPGLRWGAVVSGRIALDVAGERVLEGNVAGPAAWIEGEARSAEAGDLAAAIEYESPRGSPARFQLWWAGEGFGWEPFPAWAASHQAADEPAAAESLRAIEEGHRLALDHGCLRCHAAPGLPADDGPPPGPRLDRPGSRTALGRLLARLGDPRALAPEARMPRLFAAGRRGLAERRLVAEYLLSLRAEPPPEEPRRPWRPGKKRFVEIGCIACHLLPDAAGLGGGDAGDPERRPLGRLGERYTPEEVAAIILDPLARWPGGRMPRFDLSREAALEIAGYLIDRGGGEPAAALDAETGEPTAAELAEAMGAAGVDPGPARGGEDPPAPLRLEAGRRIAAAKRCGACHEGLPEPAPPIPLAAGERPGAGCLDGDAVPRFALAAGEVEKIRAFLAAARRGWWRSPVHERALALRRLGCFRCHPGEGGAASPLERAVHEVDYEMFSARLLYLRVPSLAGAGNRFRPDFLAAAVERGVAGARPSWYTYRMPAYGPHARAAVEALIARDGEPADADGAGPAGPPPSPESAAGRVRAGAVPGDAALIEAGRELAGHGGYSCISCHAWKQASDFQAEPGSAGPDLTAIAGRVRREWFDRWLESPARFLPGTPMPSFFPRGTVQASIGLLGGEPELQKEALWRYLGQGAAGLPPRMHSPAPLPPPASGKPPRLAQAPLVLPGGEKLDALAIQFPGGDVVVYDVERLGLHSWWEGASLLRDDSGWRKWVLAGKPLARPFAPAIPLGFGEPRPLAPEGNARALEARHRFSSVEALADGARVRIRIEVEGRPVDAAEELRIEGAGAERALLRSWRWEGLPAGVAVHVLAALPDGADAARWAKPAPAPGVSTGREGNLLWTRIEATPGAGAAAVAIRHPRSALPAAAGSGHSAGAAAAAPAPAAIAPAAPPAGPAPRPGYRAVEVRPASGELIMPCALSVRPIDDKLFLASMKTGIIHRVDVPSGISGGVVTADFTEYAGPYQEPYGLAHRGDGLYVLHRRSITRLRDLDGDGRAELSECVFTIPQGLVSSYDWGYGLVPEPDGSFLFGLAPWANRRQRGSGGVLRLRPDGALEDVAFGLRNPVGWSLGPGGGLFVTDNQGEWVAANRVCAIRPGRFYGFPNPEQPERRSLPAGGTALWVPYAWARSLNGIAHDTTGGRFGPFSGQLFLAELYSGGAIIRAALEEVHGEWQGACFPFWGTGLLGPLVLAFDREGGLWTGSITEPSWMGQPDRGALYRIEFTGETPFEILSMSARPAGFELAFTLPAGGETAGDPSSYELLHYRYSYGPEYGSPELDRTPVPIRAARARADGRRVRLDTAPLLPGRIYRLRAAGVRSAAGLPLVHPDAAYTLNEVPAD